MLDIPTPPNIAIFRSWAVNAHIQCSGNESAGLVAKLNFPSLRGAKRRGNLIFFYEIGRSPRSLQSLAMTNGGFATLSSSKAIL